jgi:hypothetical protein
MHHRHPHKTIGTLNVQQLCITERVGGGATCIGWGLRGWLARTKRGKQCAKHKATSRDKNSPVALNETEIHWDETTND